MSPTEIKATAYNAFLTNKRNQLAEEQRFLKMRMEEANRSDADDPQDRASETTDELYRRIDGHQATLDALSDEIDLLERQDLTDPESRVSLGALVQTDHGWYYVAVSHPVIDLEGTRVVGVSAQSPWYQAARTLAVGESFALGPETHRILGLY